jgi:sulfotransferase family protein
VPTFKIQKVLKIARGIRVFLNLDIGATRSEVVDLKRQIKVQARQIERQKLKLARLKESQRSKQSNSNNVRPENLIWVFGTMRVGSTWLGAMMNDLTGHRRWREPMVGMLFGSFFYHLGLGWDRWTRPYKYRDFIFSSSHKETWLNSIRYMVLEGARARFSSAGHKGYLVIQEPTGSSGAPWLMEALPESRMVFLIRDPRDVVASMLDAFKKGGWFYAEEYLIPYEFRNEKYLIDQEQLREAPGSLADTNPTAFVEDRAKTYLRDIGNVKQAYEAHKGPKVLIRYEDLRADTLSTIKRLYSTLKITVDEEQLARIVAKHSWENIPEGEKGEGMVRRKATPGGWRDDLSPEQVAVVEKITAPLLREFYPT